ncbi:hypothetical protein L6164_002572 [Bauhinia variegata]|uniref:Uncharacterized protein n=1 Tax=Bauhinia variegata TaxID=167791 RepID=A0ACB9PZ76_BAUVA|nr:hypothetical protein L6164_002572 [Bauhinia variegata]
MMGVWFVVLMVLSNGFFPTWADMNNSTVPDSVNIGVLYSFNTTIGIILKIAIEAAVEDVNSDSSIIGKTQLKVLMQEDSKYKGFLSIVEEFVEFYGWRKVITVYVDDHYGRNGISALGDKLAERRCKISFKAPMTAEATKEDITDIATSFLSTLLYTARSLPSDEKQDIQGVVTLRMYTPETELKRRFVSRWHNLTRGSTANGPMGLTTYCFYAYDTVWLLARVIDTFFKEGNRITFSNDSNLFDLREGSLHLDALTIFNEGNKLDSSILGINMTGVTGQVKYTSDGNLVNPAYEALNVIGTGTQRIGYWSNHSGSSIIPPESFKTSQSFFC